MDFTFRIIILAIVLCTTEAEFCYRKIHGDDDTLPGGSVCRGLIEKTSFPSSRACCNSDDGLAYSTSLITLGKRGKKYRCIPCTTQEGIIPNLLPSGSGWSEWGEYTPCSVSCGPGSKTRQRYCQESDPTQCEGEDKEVKICVDRPRCPVNGNWGPWQSWTDCTQSCGGGMRNRTRLCNNPRPQYGGLDCEEEATETGICNVYGCPVDGGWSEWTGGEGFCSVTCGKGLITRLRECNTPVPKHGGKYCAGKDSRTESCQVDVKCPIHGAWSLWSRYAKCSGTCGQGTRYRTRKCVAPRPKFGGEDCVGIAEEIQECYHHYPCPIDGNWSQWNRWGQCLGKPCSTEEGIQTRTRTCTDPQPQFLGKKCNGTTIDSRRCVNNENCPVHGDWCGWTEYSECRPSDKKAFRIKTRDCLCPRPENGGRLCIGDDFRLEACADNTGEIITDDIDDGSGSAPDDEDFI